MNAGLHCEEVTVRFGALNAIDGFSFDFGSKGVYGLIGPNGAGKTTLLNVLSGRLPPAQGTVRMDRRDITHTPVHERARMGFGRSFQITKVFTELSVIDNLRVAVQVGRRRRMPFWPSPDFDSKDAASIEAMLGMTALAPVQGKLAGELSYGMLRGLELGMTLMAEPRVLLLDEPLAGVGHHEMEATVRLVREAARDRLVVLVEHNMDAVMRLSDRVIVMSSGRLLAQGRPEEIQKNSAVRAVYLGEEDAQ